MQHDETVRCLRDASCRCPRCVRGYEALSGDCRPVLSSDRHALRTPPERACACEKYAPVSAASVVSARTDEGAIITRLRSSEQQPRSELRCRLDTHFAAAQEVTPAPAYDAPRAAVGAPAAATAAPMPFRPRQLSDDEETLAWASDEDLDETVLHEPPLRPPTTYGGFASVASGRFREAARAAAQRVATETARMVEARRATETTSLDELRQKVALAKEHLRQVGEETSREIAIGGARLDALLKRAPAPREASAGATAPSLAAEIEAAAKAATNAAAATAMAAQLAPRLFSSSISSNREIVPEVTAAGRYNVALSSVLPPPSLCRQWTPANVYKEALRQKMRTAATIGLSGGKEGGYAEVEHDQGEDRWAGGRRDSRRSNAAAAATASDATAAASPRRTASSSVDPRATRRAPLSAASTLEDESAATVGSRALAQAKSAKPPWHLHVKPAKLLHVAPAAAALRCGVLGSCKRVARDASRGECRGGDSDGDGSGGGTGGARSGGDSRSCRSRSSGGGDERRRADSCTRRGVGGGSERGRRRRAVAFGMDAAASLRPLGAAKGATRVATRVV